MKSLLALVIVSTVSPTPHGVGGLKSFDRDSLFAYFCPTPHGVGGLKYEFDVNANGEVSPTPHGVGGLKFCLHIFLIYTLMSHPTRGGWIEIKYPTNFQGQILGPTPHGVGGLKYVSVRMAK